MADIRLRDLSPEYMKKIDAIGGALKLKKDPRSKGQNMTPRIMLALVDRFQDDQRHIAALVARNSQLHRELERYQHNEGQFKGLVRGAQLTTMQFNRELAKLLKQVGQKRKSKKKPAR